MSAVPRAPTATELERHRQARQAVERGAPDAAELLAAAEALRPYPGSRFRLYSLSEIRALPRPEPLVPGAITVGNLICATGCEAFWLSFKAIFGDRVFLFRAPDRPSVKRRSEMIRILGAARGPFHQYCAAVVYFGPNARDLEWWSAEAGVVAEATSPTSARFVGRLREFGIGDDHGLKIHADHVTLVSFLE